MTFYDIIMQETPGTFTRSDWARLGRREIVDEDTIRQMLMEGYEAVADDA